MSKHQVIEVEVVTRVTVRLPADELLPEVGPYSRESMLRREVQRWTEHASRFAKAERSDPGVVAVRVEVQR